MKLALSSKNLKKLKQIKDALQLIFLHCSASIVNYIPVPRQEVQFNFQTHSRCVEKIGLFIKSRHAVNDIEIL